MRHPVAKYDLRKAWKCIYETPCSQILPEKSSEMYL